MKVKLIQRETRDGRDLAWKRSRPFHVNPRGILTHRVRSITTINGLGKNGRKSWEAIHYFCGNQVCGSWRDLRDEPPANRLVCERCEQMAIALEEKSSDELVGHHVHVGRLRAFRTCCEELNQ